jgi:hypothetical protein
LVVLVVGAIAFQWRYDNAPVGNKTVLVRTNRFTGRVEVFNGKVFLDRSYRPATTTNAEDCGDTSAMRPALRAAMESLGCPRVPVTAPKPEPNATAEECERATWNPYADIGMDRGYCPKRMATREDCARVERGEYANHLLLDTIQCERH